MAFHRRALRACLAAAPAALVSYVPPANAQQVAAAEQLGDVTVIGPRPSSLPTELPTTVESITRKQIDETINATDAEDALKYFPSLIVRKRYIGDYDHAVLGSRASGTGNSARSLVYADGILLSNLLGNGATFTPRWGLVTPQEIERVDVLYGPFSAAYPGNSVGAVVDFVTRMPTTTEAHATLDFFGQHFRERGADGRYGGGEGSVAVGSRAGPFAWWVDVTRDDSEGQPVSFANRLQSAGVPGGPGVPVTGAVFDQNPKYQNWFLLGSTTQTHTTQDQAKVKLSYDLAPDVRATYIFAAWKNDSVRSTASYLRDPNGNPVYSGNVTINGLSYALTASDFAPTRSEFEHNVHGLTLKSATQSNWDFEANASVYAYQEDIVRTPTVPVASASTTGAGTITDGKGSGWTTLDLKATWRPDPATNTHVVEFGAQRDAFALRTRVSTTADWIAGGVAGPSAQFNGDTDLTSLWAQDAWRFAPDWKAIVGARGERWTAHDGQIANATSLLTYAPRRQGDVSPKAAVGYTGVADWEFKASLGRAVRFPTVSELYQGAIVGNVVTNNDPNLRPERSWTSELTAEHVTDRYSTRFTYFHERTHDALYSQTNVTVTPNVTNIQNVDLISTNGFEVSATSTDLLFKGFDLSGSATRALSHTLADAKFPQAVGKLQPRVPDWRANLLATWHATSQLVATLGARYSGRQYSTLDNSDPNAFTYTGFSSFFVVDTRVRYRIDPHWTVSAGIDNLNNQKYWAFHPYPQRTFLAGLGYDL
jgi:iron complex outermembrane receptor protein